MTMYKEEYNSKEVKSPFSVVAVAEEDIFSPTQERKVDMSGLFVKSVTLVHKDLQAYTERLPFIAHALVGGFKTRELTTFLQNGKAMVTFYRNKGVVVVDAKHERLHLHDANVEVA